MDDVHSTQPRAGSILVVEDDHATSRLISLYLKREGFATVAAFRGYEALSLAAHHPVLTILDVMLPDLDGWEICRRLSGAGSMPILILSALGEDHDRIKGLTLGADDYMVKPFCFAELVARVHAILRRVNGKSAQKLLLSHGEVTLDVAKRTLRIGRRDIALTRSEFRLLQPLMASPGRIFDRHELVKYLYPAGGIVVDRAIDVHIGKLRQKIELDASNPRYILTARGHGYRFAENLAPATMDSDDGIAAVR